MFYFNKKNPLVVFGDIREETHELKDGDKMRHLEISPDVVMDFTDMPFKDESFHLVVFDPPHMTSLGKNSWMARKYGRLEGDWKETLRRGFEECFRVLKTNGTLIFKWNEYDVRVSDILALTDHEPIFGHRSGKQQKTHWIVFFKEGNKMVTHIYVQYADQPQIVAVRVK